MQPKLTFNLVRTAFEERGYKLLEEEYKGKDIPMRYECPSHPNKETKICYNSLRNGNGCRYCASERLSKRFRMDFTEVKKRFAEVGYILLISEERYENARQKLPYQCPQHPEKELEISLDNLSRGKRCYYCQKEKTSASLKVPEKKIKEFISKKGMLYVGELENSRPRRFQFICPSHPDKFNTISIAHLKKNKILCSYCASNRVEFEDVKKQFLRNNLEILDQVYKNDRTKIKSRCLLHPDQIIMIDYDHVRRGQRGCKICNGRIGTATLSDSLRATVKAWKKRVLEENNHQCVITGLRKNLVIHHASLSFNQLKKEVFRELGIPELKHRNDYSEEEVERIWELFKIKHDSIIGVPIYSPVHKLFHRKYGNNCTLDDLWDFKRRFLMNEFEEL